MDWSIAPPWLRPPDGRGGRGQFDKILFAEDGAPPKNIGNFLTDPDKAAGFARETGVDALSISVGNIHGLYRAKAGLGFERIEKLKEIGVALVLYGGTGISDGKPKRAIKAGVANINVGFELGPAFLSGVEEDAKGVSGANI